MKSLSPEHLEYLDRYGFDASLFDSWRAAVRDGRLSRETNTISDPIHAPPPDAISDWPKRDSEEAEKLTALGKAAIGRGELGVIILNGGMATRFGGVVKGIVDVIGSRSFLGLKMQDAAAAQEECGGTIPVFLMNSFATEAATEAHLRENDHFGLRPEQVESYTQFISVRLKPNGTIFTDSEGDVSYYGPGHGDCIPAFRHHGCLQRFLDGGGKYLFVANVDNLGARVSPLILGRHIWNEIEATVEVAPKWPGDAGGAPYLVGDRVQLIERLRFPDGFDPDIVDVHNTNTFHFTAAALDREFDLRWYYVEKKVDGRDAVQVERLVGELTRFLTCNFLRIKRTGSDSRFFPVKNPEDLEAGRDEIAEMYE